MTWPHGDTKNISRKLPNIFEDSRSLPDTSEENSKVFRSYTNRLKNCLKRKKIYKNNIIRMQVENYAFACAVAFLSICYHLVHPLKFYLKISESALNMTFGILIKKTRSLWNRKV